MIDTTQQAGEIPPQLCKLRPDRGELRLETGLITPLRHTNLRAPDFGFLCGVHAGLSNRSTDTRQSPIELAEFI